MGTNREEQERVKNLLLDTVTLLCKNGLSFKKQLKVQGLLGITMDEDDVFIVHINEQVGEISLEHHKKDTERKNTDFPDDCSENSFDSRLSSKDSTPAKVHPEKLSHRKRPSTSSPLFKGPPEKVKIKSEKLEENEGDLIFIGEEDDKSRIPKVSMLQGNANYGAMSVGGAPPGAFNQFNSVSGPPGPYITGIVPNPQQAQDNTEKVGWSSAIPYSCVPSSNLAPDQSVYTSITPRYQPKVKAFACNYPGCNSSFVHKRTMLRHQTEKHGRTPRRKYPPYIENQITKGNVENQETQNTNPKFDESVVTTKEEEMMTNFDGDTYKQDASADNTDTEVDGNNSLHGESKDIAVSYSTKSTDMNVMSNMDSTATQDISDLSKQAYPNGENSAEADNVMSTNLGENTSNTDFNVSL